MGRLLERIRSPEDLKGLSRDETLRMTPVRLRVAEENRGRIIVGASRNAKGTRATVLLR